MRTIGSIAGGLTILLSLFLIIGGLFSPASADSRTYNAAVIFFNIVFLLSVIPGIIHSIRTRLGFFGMLLPALLLFFVCAFVLSLLGIRLPFNVYLIFDAVVFFSYGAFFLSQFRKP